MPLPIQSGSISTQLRDFFRLRGRTAFHLDETVVPVVVLKDLSPALGELPASSGIVWTDPIAGGGQVVIMLNPDATTLQILLDPLAFEGRTYTSDDTYILNRSTGLLSSVIVHIVSRNNVLAPGPPTAIVQLNQTRENATGLRRVPVVLANFAAGGIAFSAPQLIWQGNMQSVGGDREPLPPFTIGPDEAVLITAVSGLAGIASIFLNTSGFYNPQPA